MHELVEMCLGGGMKLVFRVAIAVGLMLVLAGCAAGGGTYSPTDQAGFFSGVWHGWIAPFAIIAHAFNSDIRVYEVNNTGIWYDVGFYIAVISGFGSIGLTRRPRKKSRPRSDDRQ